MADADGNVKFRDGFVPDWWLERVAICIHEGGCSEREAVQIANAEGQRRATSGYHPGRRQP
jgi:hypothetical protein